MPASRRFSDSRLAESRLQPVARGMTQVPDQLAAALADRYRLERELGAGGVASVSPAEAAARPVPLKRHGNFS